MPAPPTRSRQTRAEARRDGAEAGVEHEAALAVEGRAVYVTRTRRE